MLTLHESIERFEFVILSHPERKLIAILFCSTVPERFMNARLSVSRLPESEFISDSRVLIAHESEETIPERLNTFESIILRFPDNVFIAPDNAYSARALVKYRFVSHSVI